MVGIFLGCAVGAILRWTLLLLPFIHRPCGTIMACLSASVLACMRVLSEEPARFEPRGGKKQYADARVQTNAGVAKLSVQSKEAEAAHAELERLRCREIFLKDELSRALQEKTHWKREAWVFEDMYKLASRTLGPVETTAQSLRDRLKKTKALLIAKEEEASDLSRKLAIYNHHHQCSSTIVPVADASVLTTFQKQLPTAEQALVQANQEKGAQEQQVDAQVQELANRIGELRDDVGNARLERDQFAKQLVICTGELAATSANLSAARAAQADEAARFCMEVQALQARLVAAKARHAQDLSTAASKVRKLEEDCLRRAEAQQQKQQQQQEHRHKQTKRKTQEHQQGQPLGPAPFIFAAIQSAPPSSWPKFPRPLRQGHPKPKPKSKTKPEPQPQPQLQFQYESQDQEPEMSAAEVMASFSRNAEKYWNDDAEDCPWANGASGSINDANLSAPDDDGASSSQMEESGGAKLPSR